MNLTTILSTLDTNIIRNEFPILNQQVNGHPLIYFDNAATTQKPDQVIRSLVEYYRQDNANIHRGIHTLAERATLAFEQTREAIRQFINASRAEEIIFVRGVTEAINLVASSYGRTFIHEGDEIIISGMEHHSNIVPWQWIGEERKAKIRVIPVNDEGELMLEEFQKLLSSRTRLVAVNHVSNALGTINPVKEITTQAHEVGAVVLVDGAQAGAHLDIDVTDLDCDFYCLSAHKMYGPTGVGVLYGKKDLLERMPPYQGGGEMIREVSFARTTYNDLPYKFEAGTPNIADVIAYRRAIEFLSGLGKSKWDHEYELLTYATEKLKSIPAVELIGTAADKIGVLSFVVDGIHPFDIGQMLDAKGIAVRTGHHCAQPLMEQLGVDGTIRISFAVYNTVEEIDQFTDALKSIIHFLQ